ncbi:hypothetical protein NKH48_03315 [Mesorhizobium sp. M1233]|uniref:hypothetical protein n=1 Tax=Mesorhizobium sp. M1233 TaxID=2957072 RepID=UPI0033361844
MHLNAESAAAPRTSPFDALVGAVEELHNVKGAFQSVVDRLAGQLPSDKDPKGGIGIVSPDGMIGVVERETRNIRAITASILDDINRLDRRI